MIRGIECRFPERPPIVGHAVTGTIRTYARPVDSKFYYDHIGWWQYLVTIPPPRVVVLQDMDNPPGFAAIFGEVHTRICRALECAAYVTNGAVRDLQAIAPLGFQVFSGSVSPSHAYAHVVDFGEPVQMGGLRVSPGDILHGDRNGMISIPHEAVGRLPEIALQIQSEENELFELTDSPHFSVETLAQRLRQFAERQK